MNLYIDTHLNEIVILLENNNKIIKEKTITGEKENSKLIMPTIKKVLGKKKPENIIVCNGPGSFTGVRLGVTVAKTLAMTLEVPIKTITTLECLAVSLDKDKEKIVGFSDNNGYYVGIFDDDYNLIGNYEYLTNNEFDEFNKKYYVNTDIKINYLDVINYAKEKQSTNHHNVNPIYIKKLDVEK